MTQLGFGTAGASVLCPAFAENSFLVLGMTTQSDWWDSDQPPKYPQSSLSIISHPLIESLLVSCLRSCFYDFLLLWEATVMYFHLSILPSSELYHSVNS